MEIAASTRLRGYEIGNSVLSHSCIAKVLGCHAKILKRISRLGLHKLSVQISHFWSKLAGRYVAFLSKFVVLEFHEIRTDKRLRKCYFASSRGDVGLGRRPQLLVCITIFGSSLWPWSLYI